MKQTFDLFFDYFAGQDHRIRRRDARVKLAWAAALFAAVLASGQIWMPLLVLVFSVAAMLALSIPTSLLLKRFLPPLGIALVILVVQALLVGDSAIHALDWGGYRIAIHREGLDLGAKMAARVMGAVATLLLLSAVTPAHELFRVLRWCRMPKLWVELAMLVYRYIFVLLDEVGDMTTAQQVRLGYCGARNSISSLGDLMGAVVIRSVEQSFRTHDAMVARGYTDEYPFHPMPALPRAERRSMVAGVAVIGLVFAAAEVLSR
jgi:cobalt/nickel transport system permease protein